MNVKELQTLLIQLGYDLGSAGADGVFGRYTTSAVKKFQSDHGVGVQWPGTVGPKTEAALLAAVASRTGTAATVTTSAAPLLPWYIEAARLQGVAENTSSTRHNATIIGWAAKIGGWVADYYTADEIPWCGLFVAHCIGATLPDEPMPSNPLGALNWSTFGVACEPQLGALLTFSRDGGGHVGFYVSEETDYFHVLGGNQSNKVNVTKVAKSRHKATRWPKTAPAAAGKRVYASFSGAVSTNEA